MKALRLLMPLVAMMAAPAVHAQQVEIDACVIDSESLCSSGQAQFYNNDYYACVTEETRICRARSAGDPVCIATQSGQTVCFWN
jgi:hypothetical protein